MNPGWLFGCGAMVSTVADLTAWAKLLFVLFQKKKKNIFLKIFKMKKIFFFFFKIF